MGWRKVAWIWHRDDVRLQSAAKKRKAGTVLKFDSNFVIGSERWWSELKVWRASVTLSWKQERDWLNHSSPQNRVTKGCGLAIPQWNRSVLHNPHPSSVVVPVTYRGYYCWQTWLQTWYIATLITQRHSGTAAFHTENCKTSVLSKIDWLDWLRSWTTRTQRTMKLNCLRV